MIVIHDLPILLLFPIIKGNKSKNYNPNFAYAICIATAFNLPPSQYNSNSHGDLDKN